MAKTHLFVAYVGDKPYEYEIDSPTKNAAVTKVRAKLATDGIVPDKLMYGGIKTGSVTATDLNLYALRSFLAGGRDAQPGATDRSFPNAIHSVDAPHIKRCIQAGIAKVDGRMIVLTDLGRAVLNVR